MHRGLQEAPSLLSNTAAEAQDQLKEPAQLFLPHYFHPWLKCCLLNWRPESGRSAAGREGAAAHAWPRAGKHPPVLPGLSHPELLLFIPTLLQFMPAPDPPDPPHPLNQLQPGVCSHILDRVGSKSSGFS